MRRIFGLIFAIVGAVILCAGNWFGLFLIALGLFMIFKR